MAVDAPFALVFPLCRRFAGRGVKESDVSQLNYATRQSTSVSGRRAALCAAAAVAAAAPVVYMHVLPASQATAARLTYRALLVSAPSPPQPLPQPLPPPPPPIAAGAPVLQPQPQPLRPATRSPGPAAGSLNAAAAAAGNSILGALCAPYLHLFAPRLRSSAPFEPDIGILLSPLICMLLSPCPRSRGC